MSSGPASGAGVLGTTRPGLLTMEISPKNGECEGIGPCSGSGVGGSTGSGWAGAATSGVGVEGSAGAGWSAVAGEGAGDASAGGGVGERGGVGGRGLPKDSSPKAANADSRSSPIPNPPRTAGVGGAQLPRGAKDLKVSSMWTGDDPTTENGSWGAEPLSVILALAGLHTVALRKHMQVHLGGEGGGMGALLHTSARFSRRTTAHTRSDTGGGPKF
jgi:hypothetical protein